MNIQLKILALAVSLQFSTVTAYAQQAETVTQPISQASAPDKAPPSGFNSVGELASYIEEKIAGHITAVDTQAMNPEIAAALRQADPQQLAETTIALQEILKDSIKVRLFPKGQEEIDNTSTPACSYACVAIATSAYDAPPKAEALMYNSPDANILLARAVKINGETVGTIIVHYPYDLIANSFKILKNNGLYTEFHQTINGESITVTQQGNSSIKTGAAQKIRIKGTSWSLAVWTPGGIAIEEYKPPLIPWIDIATAIAVLLIGVVIFIFARNRRLAKKSSLEAPMVKPGADTEMAFSSSEGKSPTLIIGGGAAEIDMNKFSEFLEPLGIKTKTR